MHCKQEWILRTVLTMLLSSVLGNAALAVNGAGSLIVDGATCTPTHWNIPIGVPTTARICGVTTSEAGDPLPATITVWVKSTYYGNTMLTATRIDMTDCYQFSYTPPAVAIGDPFDACGTTIVSYVALGMNANNDICDDGIDNGSWSSASGFRFVDDMGDPIDCMTVGTETFPWGKVKSLYR